MVPTLRDPTPKPPASRAGFRRAPESQLGPSGCLTESCNKEQDMCQCEGARAGTGSPSQQRIRESVFAALRAMPSQFCRGSGQWESGHRHVNKRAWLCSNKTLFTNSAGQLALALSCSWPIPVQALGDSFRSTVGGDCNSPAARVSSPSSAVDQRLRGSH